MADLTARGFEPKVVFEEVLGTNDFRLELSSGTLALEAQVRPLGAPVGERWRPLFLWSPTEAASLNPVRVEGRVPQVTLAPEGGADSYTMGAALGFDQAADRRLFYLTAGEGPVLPGQPDHTRALDSDGELLYIQNGLASGHRYSDAEAQPIGWKRYSRTISPTSPTRIELSDTGMDTGSTASPTDITYRTIGVMVMMPSPDSTDEGGGERWEVFDSRAPEADPVDAKKLASGGFRVQVVHSSSTSQPDKHEPGDFVEIYYDVEQYDAAIERQQVVFVLAFYSSLPV